PFHTSGGEAEAEASLNISKARWRMKVPTWEMCHSESLIRSTYQFDLLSETTLLEAFLITLISYRFPKTLNGTRSDIPTNTHLIRAKLRRPNMRIICDQCDQPIAGTVERTSGNFNLHPACVTQFTQLTKPSEAASHVYWQLYLNAITKVPAKSGMSF